VADEETETAGDRARESGTCEEQDDTSQDASPPEESSVDRAAASFLALESELRDLDGDAGRLSALAEDVERIPASAVPADYPIAITTDEALRLHVRPSEVTDVDESLASVYLEWPPSDDGPLARLLSLRDIRPANFADLHGERIPLRVEAGHLVPRVPPGGNTGDPRGVYGVVAGVATTVAVLLLGILGLGSLLASGPVLIALAILNFLVLPVATYLDARHLLTTTDWDQGPLFWAALAALPGVNVVSSLAYLYTRQAAEKL
jgi:hypothetical protein